MGQDKPAPFNQQLNGTSMIRHVIALAGLSLASLAAQASLTTLPTPWPPTGSTGLENVLFNVVTTNGVTVALGAHAYKNSASMPNDGNSVFYGQSGLYAADGKGYANWSFDFAWNLGTECAGCRVILGVDSSPGANVSFVSNDVTALGNTYAESWNLNMSFIPFSFDAFAPSDTAFLLTVLSATGGTVATTAISVIVPQATSNVPEPGSLALLGLGLAGLAATRRQKQKRG